MAEPVPLASNASSDWLEQFLVYTENIPSPRIFRLWAGITAIAGALERRVWIISAGEPLYPNLYVLLVGHPGTGKTQAIKHVNNLWYSCRDLFVAPHDVTKAAMIDCLAKSARRMVLKEKIVEYNSLQIAADEFGVLLPSHDTDFLSTLNRIFDNPPQHQHNRRGLGDKQIDIINPQLNILGGTQPSYLANLLPEEAWGQGFMSRVIMIHSSERRRVNIFNTKELDRKAYHALSIKLTSFTKLYGQVSWDYLAAQTAQKWHEAGCPPEPEHSKLEHYNARRMLHVLKLSIIASVSSGRSTISLEDFNRARDWLLECEVTMPDIFREMVQRSDIQVIDELHFFLWKLWVREKKGIHEARIYDFLKNRVPSEKIQKIIEISLRANILEKLAGTELYRPRPKNEHGIE